MDKHQFDALTKRLLDRPGSRRSLLRWAGVLALLGTHAVTSPAARAAEVDDAHCPAPPGFVQGFGGSRLAQTFTAQHTGKLTQARIEAVGPSSTNTDDYVIEIRNTTRKGKPGTTVLASSQVNDIIRPPIGQTTTVTANFSPGARVKKGERYALVISGVGGAIVSLMANSETGCAGALFKKDDRAGTFAKVTGYDIVFATVVTKV